MRIPVLAIAGAALFMMNTASAVQAQFYEGKQLNVLVN